MKPLHFGVVCYTAVGNWTLCLSDFIWSNGRCICLRLSCNYQIMVKSSSSFVSRSTSRNSWMSFPRTCWVSSWMTLFCPRRACRWRWSHPQHPRRLSSRPSTATPCVRSLGPSHHSPTLPPVTASMTVNPERGQHLGPWHLCLWAPWGCGARVTLLLAPTLAAYLVHVKSRAWAMQKRKGAWDAFLYPSLGALGTCHHWMVVVAFFDPVVWAAEHPFATQVGLSGWQFQEVRCFKRSCHFFFRGRVFLTTLLHRSVLGVLLTHIQYVLLTTCIWDLGEHSQGT